MEWFVLPCILLYYGCQLGLIWAGFQEPPRQVRERWRQDRRTPEETWRPWGTSMNDFTADQLAAIWTRLQEEWLAHEAKLREPVEGKVNWKQEGF